MPADLLVSAIIPTYNRETLVTEAIDSILVQTYSRIEIIVVDDGSTDDTLARLRRYGNRIRVISQNNAGPAAARNRGIAVSNGDLVAFLDSDDLWLPAKVERQVALLHKVGKLSPCCLCNIKMHRSEGETTSFGLAALNPVVDEGICVNVDEILATRFILFNQGIAVRRDVLEKIGGFDEGLWLLEDHEFALRLSLEGPWAFIREPLVIWRENMMGSLSQKARREDIRWTGPMVQILERHLAKVKGGHQHKELRKHLNREIKRAYRYLRAAKVSRMDGWGASTVGHTLRKVEQYRSAVFRRSPWFPKMKAERCEHPR
jgi:glycosyltransferase involved in cell wall biosynthesis